MPSFNVVTDRVTALGPEKLARLSNALPAIAALLKKRLSTHEQQCGATALSDETEG